MLCKLCKSKMKHSINTWRDEEVDEVKYECPNCGVIGYESTYKKPDRRVVHEYYIGTKKI